MNRKTLTKQELIDMGFQLSRDEHGIYIIKRYWYIHNYKSQKVWKEITPRIAITKHPLGKDVYYQAVMFSYNGKSRVICLSRMIWAWEYGECPGDMDVDHINDDSLDNRLENLQLLTHKDNIAKRGIGRNQYSYCKLAEDILEARKLRQAKEDYVTNRQQKINYLKSEINKCKKQIHRLISDRNSSVEKKKGLKTIDRRLYMEYKYDVDIMNDFIFDCKKKLKSLENELKLLVAEKHVKTLVQTNS